MIQGFTNRSLKGYGLTQRYEIAHALEQFNPPAAYIINPIDRTHRSPAMKFSAAVCVIGGNLGLHSLAAAFALKAKPRRMPIHLCPNIFNPPALTALGIRSFYISTVAVPVEHTAARELALLTGVNVALASRR